MRYGILEAKLSRVCVRLVPIAHRSQITKKPVQRYPQMLIPVIAITRPEYVTANARVPEEVTASWTEERRLEYRYHAMRTHNRFPMGSGKSSTSINGVVTMRRIFALLVLGILVSSAAVAQKTNIDWDRQANFSQ